METNIKKLKHAIYEELNKSEVDIEIISIANTIIEKSFPNIQEDDKFWVEGAKDLIEGLLYMALYMNEEADLTLLKELRNQDIVSFAEKLQKVVEKYPRADNALSKIEVVLSDKTTKTAKAFWDTFLFATKFLD